MAKVIISQIENLGGNCRTFNEGDIIVFDGGMLTNGDIVFNHNKIVGRGQLFSGINAVSGTLDEFALRAEWFGIFEYKEPSSPQDEVFDNTTSLNFMIDFCISTGVRNILFNRGFYYVGGTVNIGVETIGQQDESRYWDINLIGAGNNYPDIDVNYPSVISGEAYVHNPDIYGQPHGTAFLMGEQGCFHVNLKNNDSDVSRGGSINHCTFYGAWGKKIGVYNNEAIYSNTAGSGIEIEMAQCFEINHCNFVRLRNAITLSGHTYYSHIRSCVFDKCEEGIITIEGEGDANDNMVSNCMFKRCASPIALGDSSKGWHIYDCDIEGDNGTCVLGNENRMTNVRIERNQENVPWLLCKNGCTVSADIHGLGQTTHNWKCVFEGDNNHADLHFNTYTPLGFIAFGRGNYFNVLCKQAVDPTIGNDGYGPTMMIYDPEDTVIVNGFSNKEDYEGENMVCDSSISMDLNSPDVKQWHDGYAYPLILEFSIEGCTNISTVTCQYPVAVKNWYITCKIYINNTSPGNETIALFDNNIAINSVPAKWYGMTFAASREQNLPGTIFPNISNNQIIYNIYSASNNNTKIYIIDVVAATKPLYARPVLAHAQSVPYQYDKEGVIHLRQTHPINIHSNSNPQSFLNHVTHEFCFKKNTFQKYYISAFDKYIYRKGNDYYCYGHQLGFNCGSIMTLVNNNTYCSLEYVVSDLMKAELVIIDQETGDLLDLILTRSSLQDGFDTLVVQTTGPTQIANNHVGTVAVTGFNANHKVLVWVEILP